MRADFWRGALSHPATLFVATALVIGLAVYSLRQPDSPQRAFQSSPRGVMGTETQLAAISDDPALAKRALQSSEAALRRVEIQMSSWIDASEIGRLNRAEVGVLVPLSAQTLSVLRHAQGAYQRSGGAFDITVKPLLRRWRQASKEGVLPTNQALEVLREASRWSEIELLDGGAIRRSESVEVDLGGIAKGYGIDAATTAMMEAGIKSGMVDVGGDLRVFGAPLESERWEVAIQSPVEDGVLGRLFVEEGAVCTSGNYARFSTIEGERYSHILDPRTGWPAAATPSVTILAEEALVADIWATTLSVLGREGLKRLPEGVEALLVFVGPAQELQLVATRGLAERLETDISVEVVAE